MNHNVERLSDDHRRARVLAEGLARLPGVEIDLDRVETNIVVFRLDEAKVSAADYVRGIVERKVLGYEIEPGLVRLVTHKDVDDDDVSRAIEASRAVLS